MIDNQQANISPEFSVSDSEGRTIQLSAYKGKKNIMLVFNRGFS